MIDQGGCRPAKEGEKEDDGHREFITAILAENSLGDRLGGSFVSFVPGRDLDEGEVVEDGFSISLTDASWTEVRRCLASGKGFAMIADIPTGSAFPP